MSVLLFVLATVLDPATPLRFRRAQADGATLQAAEPTRQAAEHSVQAADFPRPGDTTSEIAESTSATAEDMSQTAKPTAEPAAPAPAEKAVAASNVIAIWEFLPGKEAADNSGQGHNLRLRGESRFVPGGVSGNCLECFRSTGGHDTPNGAVAANHPALSPTGAFTLELYIKPKPELAECDTAFLLDKKYLHYPKDLPDANRDYCLYLRRAGPAFYRLVAYLGYGSDSAEYVSQVITLEPNRWYHVAFTYDGAGVGRFFLDGKCVGRTAQPGRGPISSGRYDLVIGDRFGSLYSGFPGWIDEVKLLAAVPDALQVALELDPAPTARTAFQRMEKNALVELVLRNDSPSPMKNVVILCNSEWGRKQMTLADLPPRSENAVTVPVDTRFRPSRYPLHVKAEGTRDAKPVTATLALEIVIAARSIPNTMPVVMWGTTDNLDELQRLGFTHQLIHLIDYRRVWQAGKPTVAMGPAELSPQSAMLNRYLERQLGAVAALSPGSWLMSDAELAPRFERVDRQGKPYATKNVCGLFPEVQQFCFHAGASVSETFGRFPALQAALIHTEVRDSTNLCFHDHDRTACRAATGQDIPDQATSKGGVSYQQISDFPANRVVPDDHPLLVFYRWFWKQGDGWNELHSAVHRGLKSHRADLWTFFDPAVRAPSTWGSGGEVDVISQWTYSYPDPIKIGQATDELFAMAEGRPGQRVMKMTQIIWYRSQTAPKLPEDESRRAPWEKESPDARFITIAPDHLREAFWSKISRPISGIMYHGWGSLVPGVREGSYTFTNPQTKEVLAELVHNVVRPLGPALLQVPDAPSDVAILESFTSQMFAGRGTYGWGQSWEADAHLILQWAHLQPRIVYDETVREKGLSPYRILVLPGCDVLPQSVVARIEEFQKNGGLVVGDEYLTPAIHPDVVLPVYRRTGKAAEDKSALQAIARQLREAIDSRYQRRVDSSDPDLVVRLRESGAARYVFVLNDRRTYGDYVGHHGRVMEKGLPLEGDIWTAAENGVVYDLLASQEVSAKNEKNGLAWHVALGPGDGRVFLILPTRIKDVVFRCPAETRRGDSVPIELAVIGEDGQPIDAVLPVEVKIKDPTGGLAEGSGFYGAAGGRISLAWDVAPNDATGEWTISVRDLAGGKTTEHRLQVVTAAAAAP